MCPDIGIGILNTADIGIGIHIFTHCLTVLFPYEYAGLPHSRGGGGSARVKLLYSSKYSLADKFVIICFINNSVCLQAWH